MLFVTIIEIKNYLKIGFLTLSSYSVIISYKDRLSILMILRISISSVSKPPKSINFFIYFII